MPPKDYREIAAAGHTALQWHSAQYRRTRESLFEVLDQVEAAGLKMMFYPYPNDRYWLAKYKRIYRPMA